MQNMLRRAGRGGVRVVVVGGVVLAATLGRQATASAGTTTVFQIPARVLTQSWGVPSTVSVAVTATVGDTPGTTVFSVAQPVEFGGSDSLTSRTRVRWLNLATGGSGSVEVPDRYTARQPCDCAPAPVPVVTGAGQVVAIVTAGGPLAPVTVFPGFGMFSVP
ncbi:hypothetical protein ACWEKR_04415 [Nocardia sp. NPDC004573]